MTKYDYTFIARLTSMAEYLRLKAEGKNIKAIVFQLDYPNIAKILRMAYIKYKRK